MSAVGDKGLSAVEDVVVAVAHGGGADGCGVGASSGLREGKGADLLTAGQGDEVLLFLLLSAVEIDGHSSDAGVGADDRGC